MSPGGWWILNIFIKVTFPDFIRKCLPMQSQLDQITLLHGLCMASRQSRIQRIKRTPAFRMKSPPHHFLPVLSLHSSIQISIYFLSKSTIDLARDKSGEEYFPLLTEFIWFYVYWKEWTVNWVGSMTLMGLFEVNITHSVHALHSLNAQCILLYMIFYL